MRCLLWLSILTILSTCSKSSTPAPVFSSVLGAWTYTTPDNKISVDFVLVNSPSGSLDIQNPIIKVNGVSGVAAALMTGVSLPAIGSIRINANDIRLIQPYSIIFTNCVVATDFTRITVVDVVYTYPWGTNKILSTIQITRKP